MYMNEHGIATLIFVFLAISPFTSSNNLSKHQEALHE